MPRTKIFIQATKPVLSQFDKTCIFSYDGQFSTNIKLEIIKFDASFIELGL